MSAHLIIVGAGQAAAQAIFTLVQKGYDGRITLVGDEPHLPYQRPPLSKRYLAGDLEQSRLYLRAREYYEQHGVELTLGVRAEHLDPAARRVRLNDGRQLGYDALLLATGSRVRRLDAPGAALDGVHYLRTIANADGILARMRAGGRLVIVGAGYIGLEVAAVARARGLQVTVLEATDRVMSRVVCPEISAFYRRVHEAAGVRIVCGTGVRAFAGDAHLTAVMTDDNGSYPCDFAVVGIGVVPETTLAEGAGLSCENGIVVDDQTRTSDARVLAAGDCTNHPSVVLERRLRLESVQNAVEQAKIAALNLLGEAARYTQVPWFWSDQYDLKLQIAGVSAGYERVILRGRPEDRRFAAYYLREGRLIAVDAVNSPKDFVLGKKLVASRAELDPGLLEDPTADLQAVAQRAH